jgi:ribosome-binding protein aMBF1 (putative translation factor)
MIGPYEVTDPRTLVCQFCDQRAAGRVKVELYGGALMVCMQCYYKLQAKREHPYSSVMDKFCLRACRYQANRKMARLRR